MKIEQTKYELLPVGEYAATITDIQADDGMFGPQLRFTFAIDEGDFSGSLLSMWTSVKFNPKSKLYALAKAAFNSSIPPDYDLETDDLTDRRVNLVVVIKSKEDGTEFNRIDTVRPYQAKEKSDNDQESSPLFPKKYS
jgi:hypothetical protein